jgi:Spy/CpxP family protein refolding chaperone
MDQSDMRTTCARRLIPHVRTVATVAVALSLLMSVPARAQGRGPGREPLPPVAADTGVSPAEIQRLFDAYVVMQAQQSLQLTDEQYPKFLARMKALQTARQRGLVERGRALQELRRLSTAPQVDENQARAALKTLADIDARTASDVRDALNAVDQVLDTRQQIRFRLFEEQMERRKVELVMRARQANRPRAPQQP